VTVLRDGARVGTKDIGEVDEGVLVNMMVGRAIDRLYPKKLSESGASILELREISHRSAVRNISFELRRGEILGIAGLVGSGRTELALTIFGITPATSGTILLEGKRVRIGSPEAARDLGIAYIPEDRGTQGLIRTQTIAENVALANLKKLTRGLFIDAAKLLRSARQAIERFGIKARGPQQVVRELSGGNQQKVVLGKWLSTDPRILIMDEPTRGIDVGAKVEVYRLMNELLARGAAIVMISSELPEVLGMSDRILVMREGRIVAELDGATATQESVMTLAAAAEEEVA
jgi:rhamnose transport system ATP-binding protein